ncbi:hypothetical protein TNIN_302361 [Trichonephila inaurata madagascariensis]|uniref:Uncharacterized protein n=1 Tax=Trichonephila inaurata madagascariensis TaxID=2747483 RepID=A0A8X6YTF2_9ARAC|nr:hypothetical protein TNIN_302361 [Trichonephila inaurata madagascariensis]
MGTEERGGTDLVNESSKIHSTGEHWRDQTSLGYFRSVAGSHKGLVPILEGYGKITTSVSPSRFRRTRLVIRVGSVVDLTVIQYIFNGLSDIATFPATRITPAEPLRGVQLKNSKAGVMD